MMNWYVYGTILTAVVIPARLTDSFVRQDGGPQRPAWLQVLRQSRRSLLDQHHLGSDGGAVRRLETHPSPSSHSHPAWTATSPSGSSAAPLGSRPRSTRSGTRASTSRTGRPRCSSFVRRSFTHLFTVLLTIVHATDGSKDYRLTESESLAAFNALQRQGIPSRLLVFPSENHVCCPPCALWVPMLTHTPRSSSSTRRTLSSGTRRSSASLTSGRRRQTARKSRATTSSTPRSS